MQGGMEITIAGADIRAPSGSMMPTWVRDSAGCRRVFRGVLIGSGLHAGRSALEVVVLHFCRPESGIGNPEPGTLCF